MKKLLLALMLLPGLAQAQSVINCIAASLTPCNTISNPDSTGIAGDPIWQGFGKVNANFAILAPEFSSPSGSIIGRTGGTPGAPQALTTLPFTLAVSAGGTGATTLSGLIKGNGSAAMSAAAFGDIFALFSGCSGTQYPGFDGACHNAGGGSGTVTTTGSPANGNMTKFSGATSITNGDLSGDATTSGTLAVSVVKVNGNTPGGTCTNQAVTVISTSAVPTCTTLTSAYVNNTIALTGTDINTSNQVTVTHLAAALPVNQGGSGTTSTLVGVMRGGSPMTASEISGDCASSGSNAVTCLLNQNAQPNNYTLVIGDAEHEIFHASSAHTYTIPANASVAFSIGTCVQMTNDTTSSAALTVAITTDTLIWSPSGSTGSRTVAIGGYLIACKKKSTTWWVQGGAGIT